MLDKCQSRQYHWAGERFSPEVILEVISTLETLSITHMGTSRALYEYLSEGMLNILHHAYDSEELVKWEIHLTVNGKTINLSVRDFGKSIPVSLLESLRTQKVSGLNDSSLIHCAVYKQKSSNGRGLGLSSILSYVDDNIFKSLRIQSRNGTFNYSQNNSSLLEKQIKFKGTSLQISIDCPEVAE
jgi:anti-sigma regulatory factor (Ser/Thr protein kinase)